MADELTKVAERIMLDVVNEWHRQVGISDVMKTDLTQCIADTVATGVFSKAVETHLRPLIAAAEREKCAQVADGFTCGQCGMDGKTGAAIRALKESGT